MERKTAFEPNVHGFKFKNEFSTGDIIAYLLTYRSDFFEVTRAVLGDMEGLDVILNEFAIEIGDIVENIFSDIYLCGGMCWASLDRYYNDQQAPEVNIAPAFDSLLLSELVQRQIDSFRPNFDLIKRCIVWQNFPGGSGGNPIFPVSIDLAAKITEEVEWPKIKQKLDAGIPASVCLVQTKWNGKPWDNHQVLAIGYAIDNTNKLSIDMYDPNDGMKTPTLKLNLGTDDNNLNIDHSDSSREVRGFFLWPYDRQEKYIPRLEHVEEDLSWFWNVWG